MRLRVPNVAALAALLTALIACQPSSPDLDPASAESPARVAKRVSFALLEDYDKGEELWKVALDFAVMRELGVLTWRGSLGWDDFEPAPGVYDFEWLDRFAGLAARQGITLRPYVAYTPEWAAVGGSDKDAWNDPPRSLEDWEAFLSRLSAALARHANVVSLEIYNEQNVPQWWDGPADAYARLLDRSLALQTADAGRLPFFPGGLVFPDVAWIESVCGVVGPRADAMPAVALHAYPETWTPAGVSVENYLGEGYQGFVAAADRACGAKPIWINEAGFATTPGRSEEDQANWWARAIATFLAEPRVEHIGIYEIRDLPPHRPAIGDAPNYHLGLIRVDGWKKRAHYTIDMLTDLLDTGTITVADAELAVLGAPRDAVVHRHLFIRPDGRRVAFVWTTGAPVTVNLRFEHGAGDVTEYLLDGWHGPVAVTGSGLVESIRLETRRPRVFVADP